MTLDYMRWHFGCEDESALSNDMRLPGVGMRSACGLPMDGGGICDAMRCDGIAGVGGVKSVVFLVRCRVPGKLLDWEGRRTD